MTTVNSIQELFATLNTERQVGNRLVPQAENLNIDFDLELPLDKRQIRNKFPIWTNQDFIFQNCTFSKKTTFKSNHYNLYFNDCSFNDIDAVDVVFEGKVRFRECHFLNFLALDNTTFSDLADFWHSTFHNKVVFHKVDFEKTVVFSGSIFEENVLFTYTLFAKLGIFRGTVCKKGFDISLSILEGTLSIFDFELSDFEVVQRKLAKMQYERLVHEEGDIPIKNKRETFRILKSIFEKNSDHINSLYYKKLELETYDSFLKDKIKSKIDPWSNKVNRLILWLNFKSNKHGTSFYAGIKFTAVVGIIFFYLSIISTNTYYATINPCLWSWDVLSESLKYFFISLSPVHNHNYLESLGPSWAFYIADFFGRIFVSYGIYQTVQAFRKFR
jgi:hypothetical protein